MKKKRIAAGAVLPQGVLSGILRRLHGLKLAEGQLLYVYIYVEVILHNTFLCGIAVI